MIFLILVFRSPDGHTTQQITDKGHKCFKNALFSLDNTDSSGAFEERPHQKFLDHGTEDTSLPCVLSSFPIEDAQKHMQDDNVKTSSNVASALFQVTADTYLATYPQTSTKGFKTGELKSASANENPQAMSAVAVVQQPPPAVTVAQQPPTVALVQQPPSTVALVQQPLPVVAVVQHPSKSPGTTAANHDHTLVQAEMSMTRLEDETHNSERMFTFISIILDFIILPY